VNWNLKTLGLTKRETKEKVGFSVEFSQIQRKSTSEKYIILGKREELEIL